MKKTILLFFTAACFTLPALAETFSSSVSLSTTQNGVTSASIIKTQGFSIKSSTKNENTPDYTISLTAPVLQDTTSADNAKMFNAIIQKTLAQKTDAFKKAIPDNKTNLPKAKSYLKINYDLINLLSSTPQTQIMSLRFKEESYIKGQAHPTQERFSINYDLNKNQILTLADLFKPNSNYLPLIADYCTKMLKAHLASNDFFPEGAAPNLANYQVWNITNGGLLISFGAAQIAPRYFGAQTIFVPKAILASILTEQTSSILSGS